MASPVTLFVEAADAAAAMGTPRGAIANKWTDSINWQRRPHLRRAFNQTAVTFADTNYDE